MILRNGLNLADAVWIHKELSDTQIALFNSGSKEELFRALDKAIEKLTIIKKEMK